MTIPPQATLPARAGRRAEIRAQDAVAGRVADELAPEIDHGHGQDVLIGKTDRIGRVLGQVDVQPGISRARDEQDIFPAGIFNGRFKLGQRFRGGIADETAPIDDPGAVIRGVADGLDRPPGPGGVFFVPADALGADLAQMLPARSSWPKKKPSSRTATTTFLLPVEIVQARVMSASIPAIASSVTGDGLVELRSMTIFPPGFKKLV